MTEVENKPLLLELYKQSLNKWNRIYREDPDTFDEWGNKCIFCHYYEEKGGREAMVDGKYCGDDCLIDHKICGSKDSLLNKLEEEAYRAEETDDFDKAWDIIDEIKQALKEKIRELEDSLI